MFSPISPNETVTLTFNFSNLCTAIAAIDSVNVTLLSGTDPNPAHIKNAAPVISGTNVLQSVSGCISGCTYKINVLVTDTGTPPQIWELAETLPAQAV